MQFKIQTLYLELMLIYTYLNNKKDKRRIKEDLL